MIDFLKIENATLILILLNSELNWGRKVLGKIPHHWINQLFVKCFQLPSKKVIRPTDLD